MSGRLGRLHFQLHLRRLVAPAAALTVALLAMPASAASDLVVEMMPLLGTGSSMASGWNEILVRIRNNGASRARGEVSASVGPSRHASYEFQATAPFSVDAGAAIDLRIPTLAQGYGDVEVEVATENGVTAAKASIPCFHATGVTLLDVSEASRLRGALNEAPVAPLYVPSGASVRGTAPALTVASARFERSSGDPLLPDRAALYGSVDVVLMRSDVLVKLHGESLDALSGYVLAGGTLAIAVARPEDLRHPTLEAFAGGPVQPTTVSAVALRPFSPPIAPSGGSGSGAKIVSSARAPTDALASALAGYAGGNLHGSRYGSSASYGLGEVHLLAFDPTERPAIDDPWGQVRVVDLARRAFERRSTQVFRPGGEPPMPNYVRVRQELDPNQGSRWSIGVAALLLCIYALVAGPVNFASAAKSGSPLRALRRLPVYAAVTFALIVAVGIGAKGVTGRARHLTLIEAGGGMTRGTARRWRGFFAARSSDLTVRTTDPSSMIASAALHETTDTRDRLVVDREGARLVDVAALPWQTVVLREDGFASLDGGIALVKDGDTGVVIVNRTDHDLRAALLHLPGGDMVYAPKIRAGDRLASSSATRVATMRNGGRWLAMLATATHAGGLRVRHLFGYALEPIVEPDAPGLGSAWIAMEDAAGDAVDWFPSDVPVLLGQLDGGEGRVSDSGMRLEKDRVLVRVVGFGGAP